MSQQERVLLEMICRLCVIDILPKGVFSRYIMMLEYQLFKDDCNDQRTLE